MCQHPVHAWKGLGALQWPRLPAVVLPAVLPAVLLWCTAIRPAGCTAGCAIIGACCMHWVEKLHAACSGPLCSAVAAVTPPGTFKLKCRSHLTV
jgi:hypothetical protein